MLLVVALQQSGGEVKSFRSHFPASAAQLCREWSPSLPHGDHCRTLTSLCTKPPRLKTIWGRRFDHVRSLAGVCVMAQCLQQSPTRTSSPLPLQPSSSPLNSAFLRARQNIHRQFHEHKIDLYCCGMMVINQSLKPGPGHSRLNVPTSSGRETPPQYQQPVFIPLQFICA